MYQLREEQSGQEGINSDHYGRREASLELHIPHHPAPADSTHSQHLLIALTLNRAHEKNIQYVGNEACDKARRLIRTTHRLVKISRFTPVFAEEHEEHSD